jgi:hypothetical protein
MQNEFEKQVQQKMEELQLVPSAPVWEKIEEQIRRKKDRRRLILWLPLLCLFLAAGVWWLNTGDNGRKDIARQQTVSASGKKNINEPVKETDATGVPEVQKGTGTTTPNIQEDKNSIQSEQANEEKNTAIHGNNLPVANHPGHFQLKQNAANENANESRNAAVAGRPVTVKAQAPRTEVRVQPADINGGKNTETPTVTKDQPSVNEKGMKDSLVQSGSVTLPAPVKNQTAVPKPEQVKKDTAAGMPVKYAADKNKKKWTLGLEAGGGLAGISNGLHLFGGQKSLDAVPLAMPSTGMFYFDASPEENKLHLSLGLSARRKLGRKFSFSTGLQYNMYSTSILVGRKIDSSSRLTSSYSNQYANMGIGMQDYTNHYHFIGIPLDMELRILKKLNLHTGVLVQELVSTDALRYNFSAQLYYNDIHAYKRTQLFSSTGLDYMLALKNHTVMAGPVLQYGFSSMEKDDLTKRLFSFGLHAKFLFQKN